MRGVVLDEAAGEERDGAVGVIICFQGGDAGGFGGAPLLLLDVILRRAHSSPACGEIDHGNECGDDESDPPTFAVEDGAHNDPDADRNEGEKREHGARQARVGSVAAGEAENHKQGQENERRNQEKQSKKANGNAGAGGHQSLPARLEEQNESG